MIKGFVKMPAPLVIDMINPVEAVPLITSAYLLAINSKLKIVPAVFANTRGGRRHFFEPTAYSTGRLVPPMAQRGRSVVRRPVHHPPWAVHVIKSQK